MTYAEKTTVPIEKSRLEIETTLTRYGADAFGYMVDGTRAIVQFRAHGRHVRFDLPIPNPDDPAFTTYTQRGYTYDRTPAASRKEWEQACRQRWRALALAVKAKLETVEVGISTFEEEFLAHIILPDGRTMGQWAAPEIERIYTSGEMPRSLPLALTAGPAEDR